MTLAALGLAACGGAGAELPPFGAGGTPVLALAASPAGADRLQAADPAAARAAIEADLQADPDRLGHLNDLAVAYARGGNLDAARALLDTAVAQGDEAVQQAALVNLGELYALEGNLSAAVALLETARSIDAAAPAPHYALALLADGRGDAAAARASLREALRLDPAGAAREALVPLHDEEALHLEALVALQSGDRARAEPLLRALAGGRFPALAVAAVRHLDGR